MSEKTSNNKWCAKRIIEPLAAYGLNLAGHPSACIVPIDEDQIIHVAGSLLILQNVDDPSKCMILPENERLHSILGLCFHKGLQILAVCGVDAEGILHLVIYYTQGLKVGEDPWLHFRKARSMVIPASPQSTQQSRQRQQQQHGVSSSSSPASTPSFSSLSERVCQHALAMDFSASGEKLIVVLDGIIHLVDWERNKYTFHFTYPGSNIHTIRFDPLDSTRLCVSGQGYLKLWWLKHKSMAPVRDIQGLTDLSKQTVVDHFWLGDGGGNLLAIVKEGSFYCIDATRSKQQVISNVLGRQGLQPRALVLISSQAVAVLGDRGRVAILQEIWRNNKKGGPSSSSGGVTASSSTSSALERFALTRIVVMTGHSDNILGVRAMSINRLLCWSHGYIGTTATDRLLIAKRNGSSKSGGAAKPSAVGAAMEAASLELGYEEEEGIMPTIDLHICKEFHRTPIVAMATCARKPLLASSTTTKASSTSLVESTIRVWHYRLHRCLIVHNFEKGRVPTCLAFHPSGNQLLVSFDDQVRVYQVMDRSLRLAHEIPFKGLLRIPTTKTSVPMTRVDLISFNHGGSLIAVVTGRVIQIFSFYSTLDGLPAKEYILAGHTDNITSVVWSLDDLRLFSSAQDAVLEWMIGQQTHVRQVEVSTGSFLELGLSFDGTIVCSRFENEDDKQSYGLYVWPGCGPTSAATLAGAAANPPSVKAPADNTSLYSHKVLTRLEDIEQANRVISLPAESGPITCMVTTANYASELMASLVENAVIVGTETGTYYLLNLNDFIVTSTPITDELLLVSGKRSPITTFLSRTLHSGKATALALSVDGTTLFSAAEDGTIFISTLRLQREHERQDSRPQGADSQETILSDGAVVLAERTYLAGVEAQIDQLQYDMMEQQSAINYQLEAASQERERILASTVAAHTLELKSRDKRLGDLEEIKLRLEREMANKLKEKEDAFAKGAAELELMYQKKLTSASMQFQKLKDAFNDLVVAAKDDTAEVKTEGRMKQQDLIIKYEKEKQVLMEEQEVLRGYTEYLKKQYSHLMDKEDKTHDNEVLKLKANLEIEREKVQDSDARHKIQTHMLQKEIAMLHNVMTDKDDLFVDMKVRLERERHKTCNLEQKLKDQEEAVNSQMKIIEKWETKASEQANRLEELDKIKNVLLVQLKEVRDSLPKKEKDLVQLKGQLQELDQEYGKGLQSQADSDKKIIEQKTQIRNLQQDLLLLRRAHAKKTNIIDNVTREFQAFVHGDIGDKAELQHWKEVMRQYLPCLKMDGAESSMKVVPGGQAMDHGPTNQVASLIPLTPRDITITDQAKQKVFLLKDIDRLNKKLEDTEGKQGRLAELRTSQNKFLMQEMNKLRRQKRKLELKVREMTANFEAEARVSKGLGQLLEHTGMSASMIKTATSSAALADTLTSSLGGTSSTAASSNHSRSKKQKPETRLDSSTTTTTEMEGNNQLQEEEEEDDGDNKRDNHHKASKIVAAVAVKKPNVRHTNAYSAAAADNNKIPFFLPGPSIARSLRELENMKETQRANQAEAQLDVMISENSRLAGTVSALTEYLKALGHNVDEQQLVR